MYTVNKLYPVLPLKKSPGITVYRKTSLENPYTGSFIINTGIINGIIAIYNTFIRTEAGDKVLEPESFSFSFEF